MNRVLATILLVCFLCAVGIFQAARGAAMVRSRRESSYLGWLRILILGLPSLAASFLLAYRLLLRFP